MLSTLHWCYACHNCKEFEGDLDYDSEDSLNSDLELCAICEEVSIGICSEKCKGKVKKGKLLGTGTVCETCYANHFYKCRSCDRHFNEYQVPPIKCNSCSSVLCDNCNKTKIEAIKSGINNQASRQAILKCVKCNRQRCIDNWDLDPALATEKEHQQQVNKYIKTGKLFVGFYSIDRNLCHHCAFLDNVFLDVDKVSAARNEEKKRKATSNTSSKNPKVIKIK